jgi:hypothetical protein
VNTQGPVDTGEGDDPSGGRLRGEALADLDRDPTLAQQLADLIGQQLNQSFDCPFARARDQHSVSISRGDNGRFVYWDSGCAPVAQEGGNPNARPETKKARKSFTLAEVFAGAHVAPRAPLVPLGDAEQARWKLRMLVEFGRETPLRFDLPPLQEGSSSRVVTIYEGVRFLFEVRSLTERAGKPAPLAKRFLGPWCGCSPSTAERAKGDLIQLGIIEFAGRDEKGTSLWRPGSKGVTDDGVITLI